MHTVKAKGILSAHHVMNPYRGCTHGCIYCDSRSNCYNYTHLFEDIEVKENAAILLEDKLRRKRQKCMIKTGAMCDPYMHCEKQLGLTRECLKVIESFGYGLAIQTKSTSILRDMDLLKRIQKKSKCVVQMTLTTYDEALCKIIEPNVSTTKERFEVLKLFHEEGIPTVVWMTPILPFINDTKENIEGLLEYCYQAKVYGIVLFQMGLTLRDGDREYFYAALDRHFPGLKEEYQKTYGNAYEIISPQAKQLNRIFHETSKKMGIISNINEVFRYIDTYPGDEGYEQLTLFS